MFEHVRPLYRVFRIQRCTVCRYIYLPENLLKISSFVTNRTRQVTTWEGGEVEWGWSPWGDSWNLSEVFKWVQAPSVEDESHFWMVFKTHFSVHLRLIFCFCCASCTIEGYNLVIAEWSTKKWLIIYCNRKMRVKLWVIVHTNLSGWKDQMPDQNYKQSKHCAEIVFPRKDGKKQFCHQNR